MYIPVRRTILALAPLAGVLLTAGQSQAVFLEALGIAAVGKLVGKGLIEDAKSAVDEAVKNADKKLEERIKQAGDRADQTVLLAGKEAKESIDKLDKVLKDRIDQAAKAGAGLEEQFFKDVEKAEEKLFRDVDARIAYLDALINSKLDRIEDITRQTIEDAKTLFDVLAIEETGKLVGTRKRGLYREIGLTQTHRAASGNYTVVLIGKGLGGDEGDTKQSVTVTIDGRPVESDFNGKPYTRVVSIPAAELAASFKDDDKSTAKLKVTGKGFSGERDIQLLPRFPYKYEAYIDMPGQSVPQRVHLNSPSRTLIDATKQVVASKGDDAVDLALGKLFATSRERLPFGDSYIDLPPGAKLKELKVEWFRGEAITLHPGRTNGLGVTMMVEDGRLRVTAKDPTELWLAGLR